MSRERLQKIVARAGLSSRRGAEELITGGRVRVNGRVVTELGTQADPRNDRIEVDGKRLVAEHFVYVLLHKPRKVVSTRHDPEGRPTVTELVASVPGNLYPVGRLDFHTSGALLMTNDGEFTQGMLHPRQGVPKVYVAKVQGEMSENDLDRWRTGIELDDGMTAPCEAELLRLEGDKTWIEITLYEGRNQQIRRMGEATGFPIMRLARLSFAGISTQGLRPGQFRLLEADELRDLKERYGVPRRIHKQQVALDPALAHRRRQQGGYGRAVADDDDDLPGRSRGSSARAGDRPAGRSDRGSYDRSSRDERAPAGRSSSRERAPAERSARERPSFDRGDGSSRPAAERRPAARPTRPTRDHDRFEDDRPTRIDPTALRDQATGDRRSSARSAPAPAREPYTKDRPNRVRPERPTRGASDQHPNDRRADSPRPGSGPRRAPARKK